MSTGRGGNWPHAHLELYGRRWHHGELGLIWLAICLVLLVHDRRDRTLWFPELRGRRRAKDAGPVRVRHSAGGPRKS